MVSIPIHDSMLWYLQMGIVYLQINCRLSLLYSWYLCLRTQLAAVDQLHASLEEHHQVIHTPEQFVFFVCSLILCGRPDSLCVFGSLYVTSNLMNRCGYSVLDLSAFTEEETKSKPVVLCVISRTDKHMCVSYSFTDVFRSQVRNGPWAMVWLSFFTGRRKQPSHSGMDISGIDSMIVIRRMVLLCSRARRWQW